MKNFQRQFFFSILAISFNAQALATIVPISDAKHIESIDIIALSPTSAHAVIANHKQVTLVDLNHGRNLHQQIIEHSSQETKAVFSPNGDVAVIANKEHGTSLHFVKKKWLAFEKKRRVKKISSDIYDKYIFNSDSNLLLAVNEHEHVVIWDVDHGQSVFAEKIEGSANGICFAPDSKNLVLFALEDGAQKQINISQVRSTAKKPFAAFRHAIVFGLSSGCFLFTSISHQGDNIAKIASNLIMASSFSVITSYLLVGIIVTSNHLCKERDTTLEIVDQVLLKNIQRIEQSSIGKFLDGLTDQQAESKPGAPNRG